MGGTELRKASRSNAAILRQKEEWRPCVTEASQMAIPALTKKAKNHLKCTEIG